MKKILFVNCCMRKASRTERLCRRYLEELGRKEESELQEVRTAELDISPFDEAMLEQRDRDITQGRTNGDGYRLAHDFAAADLIVIGAPYWDCSFPSRLKVYLEHICVNGVTFAYGNDGKPLKKCREDRLVYITTAGGYVGKQPSVRSYMEELGVLFGIRDVRFYCGEGLDVFPDKAEEILDGTLKDMLGV